MQYKLLASDYDNTLVPFGEHFPRPAVVKAVKKMQAAGGKFVLSTGRAWSAVNRKGQLGGIRFDYAITCNGACVVDREGRIVAEHPLTAEEMYALVDFCEDYNYPLQFNFRDACYAYCAACCPNRCAAATPAMPTRWTVTRSTATKRASPPPSGKRPCATRWRSLCSFLRSVWCSA